MITAKEAAERTGNSKPAILKAIKSGRLSAKKNEIGQWRIDPSELFRVYPVTDNNKDKVSDSTPIKNREVHTEVQLLREQVQRIDEERDRERQQLEGVIDDLRKDRDHWRQQATGLLSDQRQQRRGRRFWEWLTGRKS